MASYVQYVRLAANAMLISLLFCLFRWSHCLFTHVGQDVSRFLHEVLVARRIDLQTLATSAHVECS